MAKGDHLTAFKIADTARNTTVTPTNDPDLKVNLEAGKNYIMDGFFPITESGGGMRISLGGTFSADWSIMCARGQISGSTTPDSGYATNGSFTMRDLDNGIAPSGCWMRARIETKSDTNFVIKWAQESSNGNDTIMGAGSWLRFVEL